MQLTIPEVLVAFFASFSLSVVLTPIFRKFAITHGIVDLPNQKHKTHTEAIPYLGGLSIVATVLIGLLVSLFFNLPYKPNSLEMLIFFIAPIFLSAVGFADDLRNLGALSRLCFQSMSALFVALILIKAGWLGEPTKNQFINSLLTVLWITFITNSLNFIDNVDGGAGGVVILIASSLGIAAISNSQLAIAALSFVLAGATSGFLVWNLNPSRIFLGDSGSMFLGCILSVLAIQLDSQDKTKFSSWLILIFLFGLPILDATIVISSRIGRQILPWMGGRDHISHRLLNMGYSRRSAVMIIWTIQLAFSIIFLSSYKFSSRVEGFIVIAGLALGLVLLFFLGRDRFIKT